MAVIPASSDVLAEKRKLRKSLFRWDLVFFTVAAIVALDTLGAVSSQGSQAVFWLVFSGITFLIPYGLLTAELGTTFPVEGSVYEWVRLAFGHLAGAVTAVMYWISNPVWLGGTLSVVAIAAMDTSGPSRLGASRPPDGSSSSREPSSSGSRLPGTSSHCGT